MDRPDKAESVVKVSALWLWCIKYQVMGLCLCISDTEPREVVAIHNLIMLA